MHLINGINQQTKSVKLKIIINNILLIFTSILNIRVLIKTLHLVIHYSTTLNDFLHSVILLSFNLFLRDTPLIKLTKGFNPLY